MGHTAAAAAVPIDIAAIPAAVETNNVPAGVGAASPIRRGAAIAPAPQTSSRPPPPQDPLSHLDIAHQRQPQLRLPLYVPPSYSPPHRILHITPPPLPPPQPPARPDFTAVQLFGTRPLTASHCITGWPRFSAPPPHARTPSRCGRRHGGLLASTAVTRSEDANAAVVNVSIGGDANKRP